jgi:hypothetical protein
VRQIERLCTELVEKLKGNQTTCFKLHKFSGSHGGCYSNDGLLVARY